MLDEIEMMMVTLLINNVIPIFQVGGKPRETNFGQLPSSVILRLLTITLRVRYLLTVIISNPPITHSVMFQIIAFLKEIGKNQILCASIMHVFNGPIRKYVEDGKIPAEIKWDHTMWDYIWSFNSHCKCYDVLGHKASTEKVKVHSFY